MKAIKYLIIGLGAALIIYAFINYFARDTNNYGEGNRIYKLKDKYTYMVSRFDLQNNLMDTFTMVLTVTGDSTNVEKGAFDIGGDSYTSCQWNVQGKLFSSQICDNDEVCSIKFPDEFKKLEFLKRTIEPLIRYEDTVELNKPHTIVRAGFSGIVGRTDVGEITCNFNYSGIRGFIQVNAVHYSNGEEIRSHYLFHKFGFYQCLYELENERVVIDAIRW